MTESPTHYATTSEEDARQQVATPELERMVPALLAGSPRLEG